MAEPVTDIIAKKLDVFIYELMQRGIVVQAARKARISAMTAYRHRLSDPEFSAAWDEAVDVAAGLLESEAHRRATKGVLEPVFYQGKKCGAVRKYSDTLLIFLLKAHKPERFKDNLNVEVTGNIGELLAKALSGNGDNRPGADNQGG